MMRSLAAAFLATAAFLAACGKEAPPAAPAVPTSGDAPSLPAPTGTRVPPPVAEGPALPLPEGMPAVGSQAPTFRLPDHTGAEQTLEAYRGKRVVLWFFPKADTPGCTLEGCGFRDRSAAYAAKGVAILGISFDSVEANRAFAAKHDFGFPLLCDTEGAVGRAYGVAPPGQTFPRRATFVIGPTGLIEQVIPQVDPKSHPDALLATLPDAR